jgi:hypothetical protein
MTPVSRARKQKQIAGKEERDWAHVGMPGNSRTRTMKPWDVHASKQVRLDVSKGIRPLTAARLVVDEHESVV